jgi:tripartite-type tricarboxylate transporter receptor subunit TctC
VRSFKDLVALAKAKPGQLTAASFGNGTVTHLMVLQLRRLAGVDIAHVPYKDGAAALNDVVAGHASMMFNWVTTTKGFIDNGKLLPLLATGAERLTPYPNTPTAVEVGMPELAITGWAGFTAPANTPRPVLDRLYSELIRILPVLRSSQLSRTPVR